MANGFSDKGIKGLKATEKEYWLREGQGFAIRVYPSGEKGWYFIYTFEGRKRFMKLGTYPDVSLASAREKHGDAKKKFNNGIDPLAERETAKRERKQTPIVADFIDEFIKQYAKQETRRWKEVERALKSYIVPTLGKRKVTDIQRRDLKPIIDEVGARAPVMANRLLAYVRKMFSWGTSEAEIKGFEINPFMGMKKFKKTETVRERNLSFEEIKILWSNLDQADMSDQIKRALKLILVTGQRPGEVIGMHRGEIDESGRWWTIPGEAIYTAQAKNHLAHRVYLTDTALGLIGDKEGYIFESPASPADLASIPPKPAKPYAVQTMTVSIKKNLPHTAVSKVIDKLKIKHFVPHDLRRTVTSRMAEIGILDDMIDRVQNHLLIVKGGVRKNYNHYAYDKEKQVVFETWERKLNSIIEGKEGAKVIPINSKAA